MRFFIAEPEVAGGWGPGTVADTTTHPPIVTKLEYEFSDWLGDQIVASFPCYVVTSELATLLLEHGLTGFALGDVSVSEADSFREFYGGGALPEFRWLKVSGRAYADDFGIGDDLRLVLSERALEVVAAKAPNGLRVEESPER